MVFTDFGGTSLIGKVWDVKAGTSRNCALTVLFYAVRNEDVFVRCSTVQ
eukprot:SAG22_NODE_13983_length_388_cov_1.290657_1_plen_48_part_10